MTRTALSLALFGAITWNTGAWCAPMDVQPWQWGRFEHITTRQGLPDNNVNVVIQDQAGFLWFGTTDGLARYDGYTVRAYQHEPKDPTSLSDGFVRAILQAADGTLWVGTDAGLNALAPGSTRFVRYYHDPSNPRGLSHDRVAALLPDADGTLWVGTLGGGLNHFDPRTGNATAFAFPARDGTDRDNRIYEMLRGPDGRIWLGTMTALAVFEPTTGRMRHIPYPWQEHPGEEPPSVLGLCWARDGRLWVTLSNHGGLLRLDPRTERFEPVVAPEAAARAPQIRSAQPIIEDPAGHVWVGTERQGLIEFTYADGVLHQYTLDPTDPNSLSANSLMALFRDRTGMLWVGTETGGVSRLWPSPRFANHRLPATSAADAFSSNLVRSVLVEADGIMWVGTDGGGLYRLNRVTGETTRYRHDPTDPRSLPDDVVLALRRDVDGALWVGTFLGGLARMDSPGRFTTFKHAAGDPTTIGSNFVRAIHSAPDGALWVATMSGGLARVDRKTGRATVFRTNPADPNTLSDDQVLCLADAPGGTLWVGTYGGGLNRFDPVSGRVQRYRHSPSNPNSIGSDNVWHIQPDRDPSIVWLATAGGLSRLEVVSGRSTRWTAADGLPSNSVLAAQFDSAGQLWLGTPRGLVRFDPRTGTSRVFDARDGLLESGYALGASSRGMGGELLFGGEDGLTSFSPSTVVDNPLPPPVVLTTVRPDGERANPIEPVAGTTSSVTLRWPYHAFEFEFAALDYQATSRNRYAYRLEGLEPGWNEVGTRRFGRYTNLPAGTYTLHVKGANGDGIWNERGVTLTVIVVPPWWETRLAYAAYAAVFVVVLGGYVQLRLRSQRRELDRQRAVNERLRELDRIKDELLMTTAHEMRTPLHGMIGLAQSVADLGSSTLPEAAKREVELIGSSGRRLARLVDEVLDFSRLRRHALVLSPRAVRLRPLVDDVLTILAPVVGSKSVALENDVPVTLPSLYADPDRLQQVLIKVVDNAIKFTEEGVVRVSACASRSDTVTITVADSGAGIPADRVAQVFEPYTQADGTVVRAHGGLGLGLTIVRQLVELHGGTVAVESAEGRGSTFRLSFPSAASRGMAEDPLETASAIAAAASPTDFAATGDEGDAAAARRTQAPSPAPPSTATDPALRPPEEPTGRAPVVMVVDDEPINRRVVQSQLAKQGYTVVPCVDGVQALELIERGEVPDVVLLDVMMPRLSGYDVCRRLRERYDATVLPVLMLTAKSEPADVVEGLSAGANDYVSKPFDRQELSARLGTLLKLKAMHDEVRELTATLERRVQERTRELEDVNRDLESFAYSVSHDLRAPLRAIDGFAGRLEKEYGPQLDTVATRYVKLVRESAARMEQLIEDLLAFSRSTSRALDTKTVGMVLLVRQALQEVRRDYPGRNVEVTIGQLPDVNADPDLLRQVWVNLLSNAFKYTRDRDPGHVVVSCTHGDEGPVFSVADNGVGFDPALSHRLFGVFQRLHSASEFEGTGVGLAIVARVVKRHGGRVWATSVPGEGATFSFTLGAMPTA